MTEIVELLFFDTFAHDNTEELNLDLVQFPKPVYVTEVRIIPLGARVQADFPGGVRLGATNPSQFQIEFFVNDLGKPGASTFETLGGFEYNQNGCINLNCMTEENVRRIPTDGLVLRGWYTTITLAVYGTLTNNITEQIVQAVVNPTMPTQPNTIADAQQILAATTLETDWNQEPVGVVPLEYNQNAGYNQSYQQPEPYQHPQEYNEYYSEVPKDPRAYHHPVEGDWDTKNTRRSDNERERDRERPRDSTYQKPEIEREHDRRDRDKSYSRDRQRDYNHDRDWDRDWDRHRDRDRDRSRHEENYRRPYNRDERDERKRPRTPPIHSPKRPHTPHKDPSPPEADSFSEEESAEKKKEPPKEESVKSPKETKRESPPQEEPQLDTEAFEPILSDEDIVDEDLDYDFGPYTNNDDLVKLFIPGVTNLRRFGTDKTVKINEGVSIPEYLKATIGIVDDYLKSSITKYTLGQFPKLNTEIKEEFVHLCEKLTSMFGSIEQFCEIIEVYAAIKTRKLNDETVDQISNITSTVLDWLTIALDYDMVNIQDQPVYKIRHIKCGVRLADWCANSPDFLRMLPDSKFNLHEALLHLYDQEYMAPSIKLMIIKALDTYLLHRFAIEEFLLGAPRSQQNGLFEAIPVNQDTGYKSLVQKLRNNPSVRLKFALNSILKKLNLFEVFYKLHAILLESRKSDIKPEDIVFISRTLEQIVELIQNGGFVFTQPKRFLPVSAQFEIIRAGSKNILVEFYKMFDLIECIFLLLTNPSTFNLPTIKTSIFEILYDLVQSPEGLAYLSQRFECVQGLLRCLLRPDDQVQYFIEMKSYNLGLELAYKVEALYYVDSLRGFPRSDFAELEVIDQFYGLFCLSLTHTGRICVAQVLAMGDNSACLFKYLAEVSQKEKSEALVNKIKKSASLPYIIDLIWITISSVPNLQFLEKNLKHLFQLVEQVELFEGVVIERLNEIKNYIAPLEGVSLHYNNVSHFIEIVGKFSETVTSFPGQLVTSLRVVQALGISSFTCSLIENPLTNYRELKYKHVIVQLYHLDGAMLLTRLLQKLCDYYKQPYLHSSVFASLQGLSIVNVITPCVELLKQMLTYVIQCRNTHYKDLTTIGTLLQTYNLLNAFPSTSGAYQLAQGSCNNIIEILLVYTQPISVEIHEKDSLSKTLWSLVCGEVIRYVSSSPHTFIPGLLILSELLPLPLPIQTSNELSRDEVTWALNLRKLWSAHLHPHTGIIHELIARLCITSHPQLLNLLRRVCVQIADLAANSAVMIARGILDAVLSALAPGEEAKVGVCSNNVNRLLNFLACLVTHATLKCAVLHLVHSSSKLDEKYPSLVQVFGQVLRVNSTSTSHVQSQECVLSIIQSFCDIELTLLQSSVEKSELSSELYLANALPVKEHLLSFISMVLEFLQVESTFVTYLPAVRTLLLLTEHDYGFYHLKEQLLRRGDVFEPVLGKLARSFSKESAECLATLSTVVELLRVCSLTEDCEGVLYNPRKLKLSLGEIRKVLGWRESDGDKQHPLLVLEEILKKLKDEDIAFETLLDAVTAVTKLAQGEPSDVKESTPEPLLPEPEILLVQFSGRLIFSSSDVCDERLTIRSWLSPPSDEAETESIACDLAEIARQYLPQDFNVSREIEKLCRICPGDSDGKKDEHDDEQKVKTKKPFIPPLRSRGFPRTIQQRSDLFRSRPPNTSRPPSLHVDDFVALETCGAQPTGPTGYNKFSRELLASTRIGRGSRGRSFVTSERSVHCRQMSWWGPSILRGPY